MSQPRWKKWIELYERGVLTAIEFSNTVLEDIDHNNVADLCRIVRPDTLQILRDTVDGCPPDDDDGAWEKVIRGAGKYWDPSISDEAIASTVREADRRYRAGVKVFRSHLASNRA